MISRMNSSKVIGLVALAEKPGLGEALRIMRRELSRHGLGSCVIETPDALERAIGPSLPWRPCTAFPWRE